MMEGVTGSVRVNPDHPDEPGISPSSLDAETTAIPSPPQPDAPATDRPTLDVGVVVAPGLSTFKPDVVTSDIAAELSAKYPRIHWNIQTVEDRLEEPGISPLDLMETARDRMLDEDWDLVLVLTDLPLKDGRTVIKTQLSPVHSVGVVVVPALGAVQVRSKVRGACLRLVEEILDFDDDDTPDDIVRRARQRSQDVEARSDENPVQFTARVLGGNVSVLLGLVRANRPLTLALRMSQLIAVTAAAGAFLLITPDIWVFAFNYGPARLIALMVLAIGAVTASLIVGAKLWEKPRRKSEREQVALFNVATALTVGIGVTVFYLEVFVMALLASLLLLEGKSLMQLAEQHWTFTEILKISWMTTSLGLLGGAVGAGLEEDDIIRAAAYTRDPDE